MKTEMPSGLLWDILNVIKKKKIHETNSRINTFVAFNKIQICYSTRKQLRLLQYFEDVVVNFERVVEVHDESFIYALVNKVKMLKH